MPVNGTVWSAIAPLHIVHFRPESSTHRPQTQARLYFNEYGIGGLFEVHDRYVRCLTTVNNGPVYQDACVEFFVQPKAEGGYFNFEFNCCGTMLASYVRDHRRQTGGRLKEAILFKAEDFDRIKVFPSYHGRIDPEHEAELDWSIQFFIPFAVLAEFTGPLEPPSGQTWRANFYKCAENNSHPHWAAWAPVSALNFHAPEEFGVLCFEKE